MDTMTDDRFDPIESAHGDGSWRGLFAAFGVVLQGLAAAFNPFVAAAAFVFAVIAGGLGMNAAATWIPGIDTIPTWIRFAAILAGAAGISYLAGKLSNAIAIGLAVLLALGVIAAAGAGLWLLLA